VLGWKPRGTLDQIVSTAWDWIESGQASVVDAILTGPPLSYSWRFGVFTHDGHAYIFTASFKAR
jgi:hypothetical protein